MRVLVVEEQEEESKSLVRGLQRHGHDITAVRSGAEALAEHPSADLVLLDLGLSDMDGLEVCRRIRSESDTPIISFTDRAAAVDKILGLQAGSDDCLDRPYVFRELMARIDAVMRRSKTRRMAAVVRGGLLIDSDAREVRLDGKLVEATRREFDLLHYLASRPDVVVSRQRLMVDVWGHPSQVELGAQASRTIDTHVSSLRGKLRDPDWIITVRGVGFRFRPN